MTAEISGTEFNFVTSQGQPICAEGVILAGSYAWQRSSFQRLRPRPLLPVAQRPLIDYTLGWLERAGVSRVTICGNGSTSALKSYFGRCPEPPAAINFYEDSSPRGAAGCVKDVAATSAATAFVVADGASIPTVDLGKMIAQHQKEGAAVTIAVTRRHVKTSADSYLRPTGVYVIERDALSSVPAVSFQDLKESLIPKLAARGERIGVFVTGDVSPRVLNVETYLALDAWTLRREPRRLDPSALIDETARLIGAVSVGAGVSIGAHATIIGPVSIGSGSSIGRGAVVARSVVWENCSIGNGAVVDRCVLADGTEIEPGVTVTEMLKVKRTASSPVSIMTSSVARASRVFGRVSRTTHDTLAVPSNSVIGA
jgi:NDP-sugar pyrophosphorylase family protein